jgi:hypothetical protein
LTLLRSKEMLSLYSFGDVSLHLVPVTGNFP